jgi:PHD/YefM family antitoxin component YafN of YafNO toxin-antitoxin module
MSFSLTDSIMPMSELRTDPEKVKKQLKKSPVVITNKGRPDFGVCDLETLEIACKIRELKETLICRKKDKTIPVDAREAFKQLEKRYKLSS